MVGDENVSALRIQKLLTGDFDLDAAQPEPGARAPVGPGINPVATVGYKCDQQDRRRDDQEQQRGHQPRPTEKQSSDDAGARSCARLRRVIFCHGLLGQFLRG